MSVLRLFLVSCCVLASAPHLDMARAAPQSGPRLPSPYGSPNEAGTLAWKAKQAKESQRHVGVLGTPIKCPLIGLNLALVARRYTVVVAKIVSVTSFPDTPYHIATWYKLRVSEVVSRGPTDPRVLPLEKIAAASYAEPLLPIRDAELLLLFGGRLVDDRRCRGYRGFTVCDTRCERLPVALSWTRCNWQAGQDAPRYPGCI